MSHQEDDTKERTSRQPEQGWKGGSVMASTALSAPAARLQRINLQALFASGLLGTLALTLILNHVQPRLGLPALDLPRLLGSLIAGGSSNLLWAGLLWHIANGILFAGLYAGWLLWQEKPSDWKMGLQFGAALWLFAMLVLPILLSGRPTTALGGLESPEPFLLNRPGGIANPLMALAAHLAYGGIVGAWYRHLPAPAEL